MEKTALKSIQDIEVYERTDWRSRYTANNTYDLLCEVAAKFENKPAIEYLPTAAVNQAPIVITYAELIRRITQTANLLNDLNLASTDVVSYVLPNLAETHEIIWGTEATCIVNAINPFLQPETIAKLLEAANTRVLITAASGSGIEMLPELFSIADQLDSLEAVLVVDSGLQPGEAHTLLPKTTESGKPVILYQSARDAQPSDRLLSKRGIRRDEVASLFHTGGTTGVPKLAPHTHENEVFMACVLSDVLGSSASDKMLIGLPLFHTNAVIATGLTSLIAGQTILLATPLGYRTPGLIQNLWQLISKHGVTCMSGVPTIYSALLNVPKEDSNISTLKTAICGAAPISPELFRRFEAYSGVELVEGYGLTESTVAASFNPPSGEKRIGSIGLRLPYTEMRTAIVEEGIVRFCDVDEIGTILIRGPHVFPGYLGQEKSGILPGGWLNSGDLGRQDADGYFWLTGRSKDLIIRGGHNIDPSIIENLLSQREDIALSAAVGQPDSYAGELPCVYVVPTPGSSIDINELSDWIRSHIAERAAAPVYIEELEEMPVTAVGKIFKPTLRKMATERVVTDKLQAAGIDSTVTVSDDKLRGLVVYIRTDRKDEAAKLLSDFALNFEFT
ncbi:acyl-CoA synthetase [Kineobactrum salinum]|uniref:Acyl-CoA synthetase n=1 Tax=Kineobactrum salinum TaxID=2708301 RepID=A0A6C0TWX2_9GAMM|nr:acyl-CoA synthetase [Kineobactrum salinum]QIB64128.1 acyl-CoA synthetase [Kineobactrum salinum]